ncbi:MAG: hypothetical protein Q8R83_06655 [Legionellaceae bacterium]|nr:hypothetical protein [Legionellaceae bacterium]
MFIYKFNDFLMYQLGSLFGSHDPLRQINMVGPYVTLYFSPTSSEYTIGGYQSYNPGMDSDHDAAHSTNFLRTSIDKQFTHVHVILPGKDSLDLELKHLLMSDKSKYGISEQQIDHCAQQYQRHVEHYSLTEHKQAVHNLIRGVMRYHITPSKDDNDINNEEIEYSIRPVKEALVQSMIEPKYSKLEGLRQTLQKALISINPKNKNAFVESLIKIMPHSPLKDFDRLMRSNLSGDLSLLGIMLLTTPALLFLFIELNPSARTCIALLIFGYWTYNAPEISETIYNQLCNVLYGEKPYVDNENLKKLVEITNYSQCDQNTEKQGQSSIVNRPF